MRAIIEESQDAPEGTLARKIGDLFASFKDTARIDAAGVAPLADTLAEIDAIADVPTFLAHGGRLRPRRPCVRSSACTSTAIPATPSAMFRCSCRPVCRCPTRATSVSDTFADTRAAYRCAPRASARPRGRGRRRRERRPCDRTRDRARRSSLGQRAQPRCGGDVQPQDVGRAAGARRRRPDSVARGGLAVEPRGLRRSRRLAAQLLRRPRVAADPRAPGRLEGVAARQGRARRGPRT